MDNKERIEELRGELLKLRFIKNSGSCSAEEMAKIDKKIKEINEELDSYKTDDSFYTNYVANDKEMRERIDGNDQYKGR